MKSNFVSVINADTYIYPTKDSFFRPSEDYPELRKLNFGISKTCNKVYNAVRESFYMLGLDKKNYGTEKWNPLGEIVKPGDSVLIKPNLVMDKNINKSGGTDCLFTQPGVVAPVIDYLIIALNGSGRIIVGDAPMQECVFSEILDKGYNALISFYKGKNVNIEIVDFRELTSYVKHGVHYTTLNENAKGKIIDLGRSSEFFTEKEEKLKKMRVTNYDPRILTNHHNAEKQEYYVSQYVLDADVIINMPKPKSHRKAGATIALKNCVGINTRKEFLPHHTMGSKENGGDEYEKKSFIHEFRSKVLDSVNIASAEMQYKKAKALRLLARGLSLLLKIEKTPNSEGSWWGNDTISRTIADLNKLVFYADKDGILRNNKVRKMFIVADMIVSGEKEGPVAPSPKEVGMIAAGINPVSFDEAVSAVMGFDYEKLPSIVRSRNVQGQYNIVENDERTYIISNDKRFDGNTPKVIDWSDSLQFEATSGWVHHIEKYNGPQKLDH